MGTKRLLRSDTEETGGIFYSLSLAPRFARLANTFCVREAWMGVDLRGWQWKGERCMRSWWLWPGSDLGYKV